MSWEDPRGGGLDVAARGARMVVHHEQAKSRQDESQGLRTHGSARRWLVGAGAAATVTVVVVALLMATRGKSEEPGAAAPAPAPRSAESASASASAVPAAAAPVVTVADTEPQGHYVLRTTTLVTLRDGQKMPPDEQTARWNFKSGGCDTASCSGTLVSTSGARYTYAWDGGTLTLERPPTKTKPSACVDENGNQVPLSDSSFVATYNYTVKPVTIAVTDGPPEAFKGSYRYTVDYQNFGNCQDSPKDTAVGVAKYTATRVH